jgi:hypothetical protein
MHNEQMQCSVNDIFSSVTIKKGKHGLVKLLIKDNICLVAENDCVSS